MNLNIKKIDHVVITTECIERCVKFYQCLGFSIRDAGGRYELLAGDFKINVHLRYQELSPMQSIYRQAAQIYALNLQETWISGKRN